MNRILDDLEWGVARFAGLYPDSPVERWIRGVAEEAGEVVGAYNKWTDGAWNNVKPRTRDDVLEEMSQLLACLLTAADRLGVPPAELLDMAGDFFEQKVRQIRKIREEK